MKRSSAGPARQPAAAWWIGAGVAAVVAVGTVIWAIQFQREANQPVGEGELFALESNSARQQMESFRKEGTEAEVAVRLIRNSLNIEAVATINEENLIETATSPNLEGASSTMSCCFPDWTPARWPQWRHPSPNQS